MKKFWLLICTLITISLFAGCKKDEPDVVPGGSEVSFLQNPVEVTAEGGYFEVGYTLKNPVAGAKLQLSGEDYAWVKNITVSDNIISFDVDESYENKARTCRLEFIYPGIDPNPALIVKQSEGKEHSIELALVLATATNITLDVTPKDKNMPYLFFLANAEQFRENGLMENDEALWASDMKTFESYANAMGAHVSDAAKTYMHEGDLKSHVIKGVAANTEYVAYAYGFDINTMQPTTEISRLVVKTAAVTEYQLNFDFNVEIDGPKVSIDVTPQEYDGYFYYGVFQAKDVPPGTSPDVLCALCEAEWEKAKSKYLSFFEEPEQALHYIFNELACQNTVHVETELNANTEFVLWAFGMSDMALLNTVPDTYYFKTGGVESSDNKFTLSIDNIYPRKATVITTNDDPYIATLVPAARFSGFSESQIIEYIVDNFNLNYINGSMSDVATRLRPDTEYELIVFGCQVGVPTTKLQRIKFTTLPKVYASLHFSLNVGDFYNGTEVAALDPNYTSLAGSAIIHITANASEEAANIYFSALFPDEFEKYDYEEIIEGLTAQGPSNKEGMYPIAFNNSYIFFGVAEDADGNFTQVYTSDIIAITHDQCKPAKEFFEKNGNKKVPMRKKESKPTQLSFERETP